MVGAVRSRAEGHLRRPGGDRQGDRRAAAGDAGRRQGGPARPAGRPRTSRLTSCILRGEALLDRRGASVSAALEPFQKAVEIDPGYALAWAGIADVFTGLAITGSVSGSESGNHRRWRQRRDRSRSIRRPRRATPHWHARHCCSRTTVRWRRRSSSARWSSGRVTRSAAAGTRRSFCNGRAASWSRVSRRPAARSTAIRCPRTS